SYKFTSTVLSDLYYAGFTAYLNGNEARANNMVEDGDVLRFETRDNSKIVKMVDLDGQNVTSINIRGRSEYQGDWNYQSWDESNILDNGFTLEGTYSTVGGFGLETFVIQTFDPAPQPVLGYVVTQGDIDALEAINATLYIDG